VNADERFYTGKGDLLKKNLMPIGGGGGRPFRPPPLESATGTNWRRGSVVRTSICSPRTFHDLRLIDG